MGRRRKRFLQRLTGGPLDGQQRWMWGDTKIYCYPTLIGEEQIRGKSGSVEVPCHVYRHQHFDTFYYDGVQDMKIQVDDREP